MSGVKAGLSRGSMCALLLLGVLVLSLVYVFPVLTLIDQADSHLMWYSLKLPPYVCACVRVGEGKVWLGNFEYQNQIWHLKSWDSSNLFMARWFVEANELISSTATSIKWFLRFCSLGSNSSSCPFLSLPYNSSLLLPLYSPSPPKF